MIERYSYDRFEMFTRATNVRVTGVSIGCDKFCYCFGDGAILAEGDSCRREGLHCFDCDERIGADKRRREVFQCLLMMISGV